MNQGYDYESPTLVSVGDFIPPSKGILIGYMSNSGDNSQYTIRIWSSSGAIICQHLSGAYNGKGDTVILPLKANQTINLSFVDYVFNFYPVA